MIDLSSVSSGPFLAISWIDIGIVSLFMILTLGAAYRVLTKVFIRVPEGEMYVIGVHGRFKDVLEPGLHFVTLASNVERTYSKEGETITTSEIWVDTRDGVLVVAEIDVDYRIVDAEKAFGEQNPEALEHSISTEGEMVIRSTIPNFTLEELEEGKEEAKKEMVGSLKRSTDRLGVEIDGVEITEFRIEEETEPEEPQDIEVDESEEVEETDEVEEGRWEDTRGDEEDDQEFEGPQMSVGGDPLESGAAREGLGFGPEDETEEKNGQEEKEGEQEEEMIEDEVDQENEISENDISIGMNRGETVADTSRAMDFDEKVDFETEEENEEDDKEEEANESKLKDEQGSKDGEDSEEIGIGLEDRGTGNMGEPTLLNEMMEEGELEELEDNENEENEEYEGDINDEKSEDEKTKDEKSQEIESEDGDDGKTEIDGVEADKKGDARKAGEGTEEEDSD